MSDFKTKFKNIFIKCLPLIIVLASIGIFTILVKWVIGIFYEPKDTVTLKTYGEDKYTIVQCATASTKGATYYVFDGGFVYNEEDYNNVAGEHAKSHLDKDPIAYFTLNETALDMELTTVKTVFDKNGLRVIQFGEFMLYRLEGQYGVFAPLRDYSESTTSRKNDLYVVRQLLKDENYKAFDLPDWENEKDYLANLEKIEWNLDTQYEDK